MTYQTFSVEFCTSCTRAVPVRYDCVRCQCGALVYRGVLPLGEARGTPAEVALRCFRFNESEGLEP